MTKCISDVGNFFLSSLGIGVDKTTSPNEDNLIIRIFIMLFFSFLPLKGLKSHSNLDSIINQKKRIQYELKELDRNFYIKSNNDNLIVIRDIEGDRNLNWEIRIYDRDLNLVNDTIFELDRSYIIQKIHSKKKNYEIIFKKNYSNEKEYLYLFYE